MEFPATCSCFQAQCVCRYKRHALAETGRHAAVRKRSPEVSTSALRRGSNCDCPALGQRGWSPGRGGVRSSPADPVEICVNNSGDRYILMRVLVLHPEDVPWRGEWSAAHWALIVDLGFAGANVYKDWGRRAGARVISLHQFAGQTESYRWVSQVLEAGRGKLLDRMGLDWWEMLASWSYHELQALYLLERLRQ